MCLAEYRNMVQRIVEWMLESTVDMVVERPWPKSTISTHGTSLASGRCRVLITSRRGEGLRVRSTIQSTDQLATVSYRPQNRIISSSTGQCPN